MRTLACALFGHHNIRTVGLVRGWPDEMVCLRCYRRAEFPAEGDGRG